MKPTNSINNIISAILFIGLALNLLFIYFAQERLSNEINYGILTLGPERHLRSIGVILIFISLLINFIVVGSNYLVKFYSAFLITFVFIFFNYYFTGRGFDNLTALMDSKGLGPWVALGLIFVGYHDKRYNAFKKFLIISAILISIFVIINLISFGVGNYRGQSLTKYQVYATNLVWICPYVYLFLKFKKRFKLLRILILVLGVITALLTVTRSFLIIYFITLVFDFFNSKNKLSYTLIGFVVLIVIVDIAFNLESISTSFDLLLKRGTEDSRSSQLTQFLSQVNIIELIVGNGFEAEWYADNQAYYHLDNQWLYMLWWAGFIPTLSYFYITVYIPTVMFFRRNQDYETKVECFVLIIWSLACFGLAIYSTMSINFYFFIICIIQGRILYKYSSNYEFK